MGTLRADFEGEIDGVGKSSRLSIYLNLIPPLKGAGGCENRL